MDLWVRSQDKMKMLPNPKLVTTIYGDVENGYSFDIYDISSYNQEANLRYGYLGTYDTEERALEVLDEIQNKLLNSRYVDIRNGANDYISGYANNLIVYEMPKK